MIEFLGISLNYIDLFILAIFVFFIYQGIRHGFWLVMVDFFSFFASLLISLKFYPYTAKVIKDFFPLPSSFANALGFLILAVMSEGILGIVFARMLKLLPEKLWKGKKIKYLSIIPSMGEAFVIVAFILTLIISLPLKPKVKESIVTSTIGSRIIIRTQNIEFGIKRIFGDAVEESLTYFTINPESRDRIPLVLETPELSIDNASEIQMLELINQERVKAGVGELQWKIDLIPVARAHARDMWERKYFGHISPDGEDVGDRLENMNIDYVVAAENLALAPTVNTAHVGLMNSEGHRRNILDSDFINIGIGVIDNGIYGKTFVQIFTFLK